MVEQQRNSLHSSSSALVWKQLDNKHQRQAIRLMANLAFNILVAQLERSQKEVKHDRPINRTENPT